MRRRRTAAAVLGAVLCVAEAARAQQGDAAALLRQGVELRRRGDDAAALAAFRRAHEQAPSANTLAQMGLAEQALGQWVEAERHVREALAASRDPWVQRNRVALEAAYALIEQRVGRLELRGTPSGARVLVNGSQVGTLPLDEPIRLPAGRVVLEVRADGHYSESRDLQIVGGTLAREAVALRRETTRRPAEPSPLSDDAARAGTEGGTRGVPRGLGWLALAIGGAGIGVGIAGVAMREGTVRAYNENLQCRGFGDRNPPPGCDELRARADADVAQAIAITGFAVAVAASVASVIVFVLAPPRRDPVARSRIACGVGPFDGLVHCAARF